MDYEKKYKEIVGEIRKAYLYAQTDSTKAVLEEIFPELAEREEDKDEKIRKWLIKYFNKADFNGMLEYANGIKAEDILAWLEKQKHVDINPSEFNSRLEQLLRCFQILPKEKLVDSLRFYLNVVENDGAYVEQKPVWSEEDNNILNGITAYLSCTACDIEGFDRWYDWLKSIKERIKKGE